MYDAFVIHPKCASPDFWRINSACKHEKSQFWLMLKTMRRPHVTKLTNIIHNSTWAMFKTLMTLHEILFCSFREHYFIASLWRNPLTWLGSVWPRHIFTKQSPCGGLNILESILFVKYWSVPQRAKEGWNVQKFKNLLVQPRTIVIYHLDLPPTQYAIVTIRMTHYESLGNRESIPVYFCLKINPSDSPIHYTPVN